MVTHFHHSRSYWIVSPHVWRLDIYDKGWKNEILNMEAAFMGHGPNEVTGQRFRSKVKANDVILVGRRHENEPDIVGAGIVTDNEPKRKEFSIMGSDGHVGKYPATIRHLDPFVSLEKIRFPKEIPIEVFGEKHSLLAMRGLHPDENDSHKRLCKWLDTMLGI